MDSELRELRRRALAGDERMLQKLKHFEERTGLRPKVFHPDPDEPPLEWLRVPAGPFMMGSPKDEPGRFYDEHQHEVIIPENVWIASRPVTVSDIRALGLDLGVSVEQTEAAVRLSWFDCWEIAKALSEAINWPVRLPLEAEWERACREYHGQGGWLGNVWQWCADTWRARHDPEMSKADLRRAMESFGIPTEHLAPKVSGGQAGSSRIGQHTDSTISPEIGSALSASVLEDDHPKASGADMVSPPVSHTARSGSDTPSGSDTSGSDRVRVLRGGYCSGSVSITFRTSTPTILSTFASDGFRPAVSFKT